MKGGILVNNGEFYTSREYNYVGENKAFPAEIYKKPFEENSLGREQADSGNEITPLQRTKERAKRQKYGKTDNPISRLFESVKSVATSATVAISAIAITSTVVAGTLVPGLDIFNTDAPVTEIPDVVIPDTDVPDPGVPDIDVTPSLKAELVAIRVGVDYAEYDIQIFDIGDRECYVIISSISGQLIESEIERNGIHNLRADGLMPETDYTLLVVSRDENAAQTVHFEGAFTTEKPQDILPDPAPAPDSYTGAFTLPEINISKVNWESKQLSVPIAFEKIEEKYYYVLKVSDESGNLLQEIRGDSDQTALIKILDNKDRYVFTFEIYGVGELETKLIDSYSIGSYDVARPKAAVTDISIIGENLVGVSMSIRNADRVTLRFTYADGSYDDRVLTSAEKTAGYLEVALPDSAISFTVKPTVSRNGYTLTGDSVNKVFSEYLIVRPRVNINTNNMSIDFYVKAITNGATYLRVVSDQGESEDCYLFDGQATFYYTYRGVQTYTVYLTDDSGARLSNEVVFTADTSAIESAPSYNMSYQNPGEVGITYNQDGTVNIYLYTGFECADSSYYCQIDLGSYVFTSKEKVIVARNMPNITYPLKYSVCFDKNGVQYTIQTVHPSGTVNETNYYSDCTLSGNEFTMLISDVRKQDINSIRLVSSDGQQIALSEGDFILDENDYLKATVAFDSPPEYVTVYLMISPNAPDQELVGSYIGSLYTSYSMEIYP